MKKLLAGGVLAATMVLWMNPASALIICCKPGACWQNIGCVSPYSCKVSYACCVTYVTSGSCCPSNSCSDTCDVCSIEDKASRHYAQGMVPLTEQILALLTTPAYASDGFYHQGKRDATNQSGSGTLKQCEAQLHVCFTSGHLDSALSGVDTVNECNNACDTMQSPSQIACAYSNCQSRCYAGRVPGYADSCS